MTSAALPATGERGFRAQEFALDPHADDWQAWNLSRERLRAQLSGGGSLR